LTVPSGPIDIALDGRVSASVVPLLDRLGRPVSSRLARFIG